MRPFSNIKTCLTVDVMNNGISYVKPWGTL